MLIGSCFLDDGTMDKVAVAESDATRCSVGDDIIIRLAKIGIEVNYCTNVYPLHNKSRR